MVRCSGYEAWRHAELGSWFVRTLVYVFQRRAHHHHILDMLTEVRMLTLVLKENLWVYWYIVRVLFTSTALILSSSLIYHSTSDGRCFASFRLGSGYQNLHARYYCK